jgi:DNA-binding PucR family transcriptional regulator
MLPLAPLPARSGPPSMRPEQPGHGAVLEYTGTRHRAWGTALAWLDRPVRYDDTLAWLVVSSDAELASVRERVQRSVGDGTVRAACGPPVLAGEDARTSFVEARRLLRLHAGPVAGYGDAGLLQALLAVPIDRLAWFAERHLGPILDRPDLIETLRAWLACGGSRRAASERLHLHRNSVGYRVSQLKERLGVDPLEPRSSAVLQAAIAAHDLLAADLT